MEKIVLVNEEDKIVGNCEKLYVHQKGYLHRAFSVFVFNSEGKMLVQRRAKTKYHSGGLWSNSCCSHQLAGEELVQDINNRLEFELGIKVINLKEIFVYSYIAELDHELTENEVDHIFVADYDGEVDFNEDEVMEVKWMDVDELQEDMEANGSSYTYWFKGTIDRVVRYLKTVRSA